MTTVHIHARDIMHHDAVGIFCQQVAALLQGAGHPVRLWAENTNVEAPHKVEDRRNFWTAAQPDDILFFNHSIHDPVLEQIAALPHRKAAYFHNVTPPELIDPADGATVENCRLGLLERGSLGSFDVLFANSEVSANCLLDGMTPPDAGRRRGQIIVCPPLIGADRWREVEAAAPKPSSASLKMLFVGRLVPHKGVQEILEIASELSRHVPSVELNIVGGPAVGSYVDALKGRAQAIEAQGAVRVFIRHGVTDAELKALYEETTVCIAHSKHEGFGIPALDALAFDKPIFITPVPAMLEVQADAALVIPQNDRISAAEAIAGFLSDHERVVAHGKVRRARFEELCRLANGDRILHSLERVPA